MFTKPLFILSASTLITLTACAPQVALDGLPELDHGEQQRWMYHCTEGTLPVEYANRNNQYTALLSPDESGEKVFDITLSGNSVIADWSPWQWISKDGQSFDLINGEETVLSQCYAVNRQEKGNITLNLGLGD
ncbi:hypothetical protein L0B52_08265 [Suttonella sp. R2A3]|uniref:hypothetical protein n=1 Tax=Suttonella sp. R2A3 TaxID=2908648 RepID=UPI001F29BCE0|nr:hypothetical protein [Suttonella sp. R2A3]UJF24317.1 hypothetical protein L0B52_08265 [Suttonella sp. R2A3]